jgi:hypothetical protein
MNRSVAVHPLRYQLTIQAYVQKRHDILLDDTLRGYMEVRTDLPLLVRANKQRRWEFTIDT